MKKIVWLWAVLLLCISLGMSTGEAASLVSIRANNALDHTRVVLDIEKRAAYWDVSYKDQKDRLTLTLPDTKNNIKKPIDFTNRGGLLKGVSITPTKEGELAITLLASQEVRHNIFALSDPDRIVIDLFTDFEQKTSQKLSSSVSYMRWTQSIDAGRVKAFVVKDKKGEDIALLDTKDGKSLSTWYDSQGGAVLLPMEETPSSVAAYRPKAYLAHGSEGLMILFVEPAYEAKVNGKALLISGINKNRLKDELILYTSDYDFTTNTNQYGKELVLEKGKVTKVSEGNTRIEGEAMVLSGHGAMQKALSKVKKGDAITLKAVPKKLPFNPEYTIALKGVPLLDKGKYIGPVRKESEKDRIARSFVCVTKEGALLLVVVEGHTSSSVGVTYKEGADLCKAMGAYSAVAVSVGKDAQLAIRGAMVVEPKTDGIYKRVLFIG